MSLVFQDISYNLIKGLYAVLNNFVYFEVDEITLTGTSGTASILNNAHSSTATFSTSLTITASNFVTANAAAWLAIGVILTSSGAKLIFTSITPGVRFAGSTTIINLTGTLNGAVTSNDTTYPVYKKIPKPAPDTYIFIGNVINDTGGTKDDFEYNGTVQVQIVDESGTGDTKLAMSILNVIRGILKPSRAAVFSITPNTLIVFAPGTMNDFTDLSDGKVAKIKIIDQYEFIIQ